MQQASVTELPFEAEQFDVATAFETVYFWPELAQNFREVYRVLKPGGIFFICNEANGETAKDDKWTQIINGMTISPMDSVLWLFPVAANKKSPITYKRHPIIPAMSARFSLLIFIACLQIRSSRSAFSSCRHRPLREKTKQREHSDFPMS